MNVLFRLITMLAAYSLACIAASFILTVATLMPAWNDLAVSFGMPAPAPAAQSAALWLVVGLGAVILFGVALLPSLLAITLAEGLAVRSAVVYGAGGGALALAMVYGLDFTGYVAPLVGDLAGEREVIAAAGIAGGLVYWLVAGRRAGAWK